MSDCLLFLAASCGIFNSLRMNFKTETNVPEDADNVTAVTGLEIRSFSSKQRRSNGSTIGRVQALYFVIVVFFDVVLRRPNVNTSQQGSVVGSLTLLNHVIKQLLNLMRSVSSVWPSWFSCTYLFRGGFNDYCG